MFPAAPKRPIHRAHSIVGGPNARTRAPESIMLSGGGDRPVFSGPPGGARRPAGGGTPPASKRGGPPNRAATGQPPGGGGRGGRGSAPPAVVMDERPVGGGGGGGARGGGPRGGGGPTGGGPGGGGGGGPPGWAACEFCSQKFSPGSMAMHERSAQQSSSLVCAALTPLSRSARLSGSHRPMTWMVKRHQRKKYRHQGKSATISLRDAMYSKRTILDTVEKWTGWWCGWSAGRVRVAVDGPSGRRGWSCVVVCGRMWSWMVRVAFLSMVLVWPPWWPQVI